MCYSKTSWDVDKLSSRVTWQCRFHSLVRNMIHVMIMIHLPFDYVKSSII